MQKGRLKWFDPNKNYGFIETEDGKEVFAHRKDFKGFKFSHFMEEDEVIFELVETPTGLQARDIKKTEKKAKISTEIGNKYFKKHKQAGTKFIFNLFGDNPSFSAKIVEDRKYFFIIENENREKSEVKKLHIKYIFKKPAEKYVYNLVKINEDIKDKRLVPKEKIRERFKIDNVNLLDAYLSKKVVEMTLLEGEELSGIINWFTKFEILLRVNEKTSVLIFRHAIHDFKLTDRVMQMTAPRPRMQRRGFQRRGPRDRDRNSFNQPKRIIRTYRTKD